MYEVKGRKYYEPDMAVFVEYMDYTDSATRKFILEADGEATSTMLTKLTNKLYNDIVDKVTDVDFGSIPESKGDITLIDNYNELMDTIETISGILHEYNQDTRDNIDVIVNAIGNIESRKNDFNLSFKMNNELPMMIYSTTVLSIIAATSMMISGCIEFLKIPGKDFKLSLNVVELKRGKDSLLFNNLKRFNKMCSDGSLDKCIKSLNKAGSKQLLGSTTAYALLELTVFATIALSIIPLLRELIYFFYYSRVKISDYLEIQANMLQFSMYDLDLNDNLTEDEVQKIKKKQSGIVTTLRKISDFLSLSEKKGENKTHSEIKKDKETEYTINDLSGDSILF